MKCKRGGSAGQLGAGARAVVAALAVLASQGGAQAAQYRGVEAVARAEAELALRPGAVEEVWAELSAPGLPLVEAHPFAPHRSQITFLTRAPRTAESVRLDSVLNAPYARQPVVDYARDFLLPMRRLAGSRLWAGRIEAPGEIIAAYSFLIEEKGYAERRSDPANPVRLGGADAESLIAAGGLARRGPAPSDTWLKQTRFTLDSAALSREVGIRLIAPPGLAEDAPVLILWDEVMWGDRAPAALLAAALAERGDIAPLAVALIDRLEAESARDAYAGQTDFIAGELLPELRERSGLALQRERVILAGASRRGLAASLTGLRRPDAIGAVISLSGSFYWAPPDEAPEWTARELAPAGAQAPRFILAAGVLETVVTAENRGHVMLDANRNMHTALDQAGYRSELLIYPGGHDAAGWRLALERGLIALFEDSAD